MRPHRERGDPELEADLLVAHPVGEEAEHLSFALRHAGELLGRLGAGEHSRQDGIDVRPAFGNGEHGADEIGERRLLEQESSRTCVDRLDHERTVGVRGVQHDRRPHTRLVQPAGHLDSIQVGHANVDHGDVGSRVRDRVERCTSARRRPGHLDALLFGQEARNGVHDGRVIVNHEAAHRHVRHRLFPMR